MAARAVMAVMLGGGLHSAEVRELMHLLHAISYAGHKLKEAAEEFIEPDEDKGRRRR